MLPSDLKTELEGVAKKVKQLKSIEDELSPDALALLNGGDIGMNLVSHTATLKTFEILSRYFDLPVGKIDLKQG